MFRVQLAGDIANETRREWVADMKPGVTRILSPAVILAAATAGGASAQSWSAAAAPAQECRRIQSYGSGFLEQCGDRLNSFALKLLEFKREAGSDLHGRFSFYCPIELMCEGEPTIVGIFVAAEKWQTGARMNARCSKWRTR
jgi:hypothetical protein